MRWYEIPGLGVTGCFRQDKSSIACDADYTKLGIDSHIYKKPTVEYWNQMCVHIVVGAYHNLKVWIGEGTPPPRAENISLSGSYPDVRFNLDPYGNHIGGIRHTYLEVPIAVFNDAINIEFFDKSLKNILYAGKSDYISKVRAHAEKMVKERWFLPSAVKMLVEQAEGIEW